MVVIILLSVLVQAVTGLFSSDDILAEGPFSSLVSNEIATLLTGYHLQGFNFLLLLIAGHLFAVIYHEIIKRDPIVKAMVTGYKPNRSFVEKNQLFWVGWRVSLSILVFTASIFIGVILLS